MTTNTNPAATLFATTREPSQLAALDHAPRIGYSVSIIATVALVVGIIWYCARAVHKAQAASEAERAALEARRRAALAAIDPGTLAQEVALGEAQRVIARSRRFAKEFAK